MIYWIVLIISVLVWGLHNCNINATVVNRLLKKNVMDSSYRIRIWEGILFVTSMLGVLSIILIIIAASVGAYESNKFIVRAEYMRCGDYNDVILDHRAGEMSIFTDIFYSDEIAELKIRKCK